MCLARCREPGQVGPKWAKSGRAKMTAFIPGASESKRQAIRPRLSRLMAPASVRFTSLFVCPLPSLIAPLHGSSYFPDSESSFLLQVHVQCDPLWPILQLFMTTLRLTLVAISMCDRAYDWKLHRGIAKWQVIRCTGVLQQLQRSSPQPYAKHLAVQA